MEHPTTPGTPTLELALAATPEAPTDGPLRLGILGGSYNPITNAHIQIAAGVVEAMGLHEVLFCLSKVPPHKEIFGATLDQRLDMMRLAAQAHPFASVGLCSHGLFLDIYQSVTAIYPAQTEVFVITGRDAAERILTWHYDDAEAALREMFTSFQLIACNRDGAFEMPDDPMLTPYHHRIHSCRLDIDLDHISSTAVRDALQQGQSIDDFVPAAVAEYIHAHRLYL